MSLSILFIGKVNEIKKKEGEKRGEWREGRLLSRVDMEEHSGVPYEEFESGSS